jgi:hypothetical protein
MVKMALFCVASVAAMALCSCATSYQTAKGGTGYASTQTATNEFDVSFQGNADTEVERAYDFALLRSAEVTLEHCCRFFSVLDVTNTSSAKRYTSVYRTYCSMPMVGAQDFGRYDYIAAPSMVQVQQPSIYFTPGVVLHIRCFPEKPERSFAYDAEALRQTLRKTYKLR